MSNGAVIAAAAAIANAVKAFGVVVKVKPEDFQSILRRSKDGLVVVSQEGLFSRKYRYLLSYKGLTFFTKSPDPLQLPPGVETVHAGSISIPQ